MFEEDLGEERFNVNRGRDAFIDQILNIPDPVSRVDIEEISELLENRKTKGGKHL